LGPVRAQLVRRVQLSVRRVIADGEYVVVEASGKATTKAGKSLRQRVLPVYRVSGGKVVEVTEYIDTELASEVLVAPWATAPRV